MDRTTNSSPPTRATVSLAADDGFESAGDALQHLVAGVVPANVVDFLEAVEVDHHQRERVHRPAGALEGLLDAVVQERPVRQPGERVPEGERLGSARTSGQAHCQDGGHRAGSGEPDREAGGTRLAHRRRAGQDREHRGQRRADRATPARGRLAPLVRCPHAVLVPSVRTLSWADPQSAHRIALAGAHHRPVRGKPFPRTSERVCRISGRGG